MNTLTENKELPKCPFGFVEKDKNGKYVPHKCTCNCKCEYATFGICNEDGSCGHSKYAVVSL